MKKRSYIISFLLLFVFIIILGFFFTANIFQSSSPSPEPAPSTAASSKLPPATSEMPAPQHMAKKKRKRSSPDFSVIEVSRFPTIETMQKVEVGQEFALQFSLTEELISPESTVSDLNKNMAEITDKSRLNIKLPEVANQKNWEIDVFLSAPDFEITKGNISSIILPKIGDSTPAVFYLKAKEIFESKKVSKCYITLWYQGIYLAKIVRSISIVRSALIGEKIYTSLEEKTDALPDQTSVKSIRSTRAFQPIKINFNATQSDLTLFILEDTESINTDKTEIIIHSPYLQPTVETVRIPSGIESLLNFYYEQITEYGFRGISTTKSTLLKTDAEDAEKEEFFDLMRGFGRMLYWEFAPSAFKEAFWTLKEKLGPDFDSIQIITNNPVLPWELMCPVHPNQHDESDFLGVAFSIGRWHIGNSPSQLNRPPQNLPFRKLVVVAPNYTSDQFLEGQSQELEALSSIQGHERLPGRYKDIRRLFRDPPDGIVHFAGHGVITGNADSVFDYAIRLEDGVDLTVGKWKGLISHSIQKHPIYFFNACDLGKAKRVCNFVDGWAPAVLESGAAGYIGALWPLSDKGAAQFAIQFYRTLGKRLKNGGSAEMAFLLKETRKLFLTTGDPTFLAYVFYGDPHLRLIRQ